MYSASGINPITTPRRTAGAALVATLLLAALVATSAGAQTTTRQTLTLAGAERVVAAARAEAARLGAGGAIAVVDDGGNLLTLVRLDNTFPAAAHISIGKARTAAIFRRPTKVFEELVNQGRTTMVTLPDFFPLQGGVPLFVGGELVGAVGVSGAASAQQDEEIAVAAALTLSGESITAGGEVVYFDRARVSEAFGRGAPLLEVAEYKVHASHRVSGGEAEIHEVETDIFYIVAGSATFVTGGTMVDGRATAPGELRGKALEGGETRTLVAGDVIVIPKGTPHWFQAVDGVCDYYVVKVL